MRLKDEVAFLTGRRCMGGETAQLLARRGKDRYNNGIRRDLEQWLKR